MPPHRQASIATPAGSRAGSPHVINIFDPEVIVLGGGLSRLAHLYEVLPDLVAPYVFADAPASSSSRPCGATPAASAAPPGCGIDCHPGISRSEVSGTQSDP